MNKTTKSLIEGKINDLTDQINDYTAMLVRVTHNEAQEGDLSKNTCSTQIYACKRERRVLALVKELYEAVPETFNLSQPCAETLALITTLKSERASTGIVLHAGDDLMQVMIDHPNIKGKRLQELMAKSGLKLGANGKLEAE